MSGCMPRGRREKRLDSAISTPGWWPPAVLCSAAIRAKSLYILTHQESRDILRRHWQRLDQAAERFGTA